MVLLLKNYLAQCDDLTHANMVGVLLRHATRDPLDPNQLGNEIPLNTRGINECLSLSPQLAQSHIRIYTSPVLRCQQTAHCLSHFAHHKNVCTHKLLGDPGVFVTKPEQATQIYLNLSLLEISQQLLSSGSNPIGFCRQTNQAIKILFRFMIKRIQQHHGMTFFITHDSILSIVVGYLFGAHALPQLWPAYLEGLILNLNHNKCQLRYRDLTYTWPTYG